MIEVDGAIDAPQFDRASAEPAVEVADDTYRVINAARTPTADLPQTITRVASTTLFSNFVGNTYIVLNTEMIKDISHVQFKGSY